MTRFSANLGFLWAACALDEAIRLAARHGFDAVECHWPYDMPAERIRSALDETGLEMISLNTRRGDAEAGEMGLTALPGRQAEARDAIDEAVSTAQAVRAGAIHVMAGQAEGAAAYQLFADNLSYAAEAAQNAGKIILIEPLNPVDNPGYFLKSLPQARQIINDVGADNIRLMFDIYHIQRISGDICTSLSDNIDIIGHIQFASPPMRGAPDTGELNFEMIFRHIDSLGYHRPLGAEYRPEQGDTEASLGWLSTFRKQA